MIAAGAKVFATTAGTMLVHGTVLALLALFLTRGGRLRPAWQAAVWLVVLAKLVLPWGPALPYSLADVLASLRGGGEAAGNLAIPASHPHLAQPATVSPGWIVLTAIWLAGTAFVVVRAILAERAVRAAARAATDAPADAQALLAELATRVGVRTPRLAVGAADIGPHVVGVFRTTIVVPPALLAGDAQLARAALLHELAHVRRRDALGRLVQLAAVALFWFWPVVRLASRRLERAREAACDAWALEACDVPRSAYARLLVRMAQLHEAAAPALATPRALDARVAAVLGPPVRARVGIPYALVLIAWAAFVLGGARTAAARGVPTCHYSPELAEALLETHPEADVDGDGVLTRGEACDLQAELRRRVADDLEGGELMTRLDETTTQLLDEPLCCNSPEALGPSEPESQSCQLTPEGVSR